MREHRAIIIGVGLLFAAFASDALTLGRVTGAALIGKPLDIAVQVQMDAGEDTSSLCFDADVFHADARQDPSRVRVNVEATAQAHVANVRILSAVLVDEPVVTIYLRTGCGQKTTRRYVLLADFPSEVAAPLVPLVAPVPTDLPAAEPIASTAAVTAPAAAPVTPVPVAKTKVVAAPRQMVRPETDRKRPEAKPAVASSKSAKPEKAGPAVRAAGQPRLKLDPLEQLSNRIASLESSTPATPPEDALRDMQRTKTLEGDVKALLALAAKNEASLADLKARLQLAEAERFPSGVIYGLVALVFASLAAVAWLWRRQRQLLPGGDAWWSGATAKPVPDPRPGSVPVTARKDHDPKGGAGLPAAMTSPVRTPEPDPAAAFDVSHTDLSESDFARLMVPAAAPTEIKKQAPAAAQPSVGQALFHSFSSAAVLDVRQQAELFISLGQTDQAVRILEKQINESDEPNPFVYLDLLAIFHSRSLKTDFRQFREDFNQLFNGSVPDFAFFTDEGRGLDDYPEVLSHISALWPTRNVLEVIEACIFRDPWDAQSRPFDLAAFRDLLLLHEIAQSMVRGSERDGGKPGVEAAPNPAAQVSPARYPVGVKAVEPRSKSLTGVQPDVVLDELELPQVVNTDGSDPGSHGPDDGPASGVDIDLPLWMPDDHQLGVQSADGKPGPRAGGL